MGGAGYRMQNAGYRIQDSGFGGSGGNVQRPTPNVQRPTPNAQRPTPNAEPLRFRLHLFQGWKLNVGSWKFGSRKVTNLFQDLTWIKETAWWLSPFQVRCAPVVQIGQA